MTSANNARGGGAGGYAPVNGLQMYYELHGTGGPLILLHGAYMTIEGFGSLLPPLPGLDR